MIYIDIKNILIHFGCSGSGSVLLHLTITLTFLTIRDLKLILIFVLNLII